MRTVTTAAAAACALLVACTSGSPSSSPNSTDAPGDTSAAGSSVSVGVSSSADGTPSPMTSAPAPATSSAGVTPPRPTPTKRTSSAPSAPTAQTYLLRPSDVGTGFETTTKIDAAIPSLCGGGAPDRGKPIRTTAQIGFFDGSRRILIAEKVNTYADPTTAAQINSVVLAFDSCGSTAKYNGLKATVSAARDLPGAVLTQVDSGGARDVRTSQATVVFETIRKGNRLVQLTFTSIGGTPSKAVVDEVTAKAAQRLR